ncbi:MAG: hypothetical protein E7262_09040 [Lachnospiraceae bacterium]|nr:hypothetical protein [Lachnospiraceae bacterium]
MYVTIYNDDDIFENNYYKNLVTELTLPYWTDPKTGKKYILELNEDGMTYMSGTSKNYDYE